MGKMCQLGRLNPRPEGVATTVPLDQRVPYLSRFGTLKVVYIEKQSSGHGSGVHKHTTSGEPLTSGYLLLPFTEPWQYLGLHN